MRIIIEGAGEVGSHLAKMLRDEGNDITVIDDNQQRINDLSAFTDVETVCGNPSSIAVLKAAGVASADLFIAVYPFASQEINILGSLLAKQLGVKKVIARVSNEEYLNAENRILFKQMGIEMLFYPEKSAADEISDYLKHNSTAEVMGFAKGKLQIAVFKLNDDTPVMDMTLKEFINSITPEENKKFRIIAISRDDKTIIPNLSTKFMYGDLVFTISMKDGAELLHRKFGKTTVNIDKVMILGGNDIAEMLAKNLAKNNVKVKLIEKDKSRCIELTEKLPSSIEVVNGDGRNSDFLYDEGIQDYDAFISLTGNDDSNVLTCVVARKFGVARTIAQVENIEYAHLAEEMGVDNVINKKLITASRIFRLTLSGRAKFVRYMSGTRAEVIEYTAAPDSLITRKALKEHDFPADAIIGGIIRGNEAFIAVGDTQVEPYDKVAVFALPQSVREVDRFFR